MGGGSSTGASYATAAPAPAEAAPLPNASSSASSGSVLGKGAERRVEAVASTRATSSASGAAESHSWHGTQDGRIREKLMQAIRFRKKYLHQAAVVPPVDPAADTTRATLAAGKVMVMVDGVAEIPGVEGAATSSCCDRFACERFWSFIISKMSSQDQLGNRLRHAVWVPKLEPVRYGSAVPSKHTP
ncbi:unnamed protein product [Durusdinium trenchii]|uniref:Uncharacterized protein n=1 Tax=Durusdinium trenchii TaxID=1381693 RepID=A0ABP0REK1_9DINO